MSSVGSLSIQGDCAPEFARVQAAFESNFRERGELGAAVCVYQDGKKVVDLWGGVADPETGAPWRHDTIVSMMSVGKSMVALCVLILADRGKIDLDAPMATYWPEFAQGGKAAITVRTVLQAKAGLLYVDAAPDGAAYDWDVMIRALEVQEPVWEPGTKGGYHSVTAGFLLGELINRVDGRRFDRFFDEEVAGALGVDYRFGLRWADFPRKALLVPNPESHTFVQSRNRDTKLGRAWRVRPETPLHYNDPTYLMALFPSSNGHGNARAMARIYACLANFGELDGVRLLSKAMVEQAREQSWDDICQMTDRHFAYACGFFLPKDPHLPWRGSRTAFGHPGAGGALGMADPEARLSFSYSPNFMCAGGGVGDRCEALLNSLFA